VDSDKDEVVRVRPGRSDGRNMPSVSINCTGNGLYTDVLERKANAKAYPASDRSVYRGRHGRLAESCQTQVKRVTLVVTIRLYRSVVMSCTPSA
jgi:hypothetical protein